MELCAWLEVFDECRWNCLRAQYIIMIVGGIVCVCFVVHCDCLWICGSVQEFMIIVGGIAVVFSSL